MKQFTIERRHNGNELLIYPARIRWLTSEGPYLQIRRVSETRDQYEVVRAGHVRERGNLWKRHQHDIDETIDTLLNIMKGMT
jgi:hypothetical protein